MHLSQGASSPPQRVAQSSMASPRRGIFTLPLRTSLVSIRPTGPPPRPGYPRSTASISGRTLAARRACLRERSSPSVRRRAPQSKRGSASVSINGDGVLPRMVSSLSSRGSSSTRGNTPLSPWTTVPMAGYGSFSPEIPQWTAGQDRSIRCVVYELYARPFLPFASIRTSE